MKPRTCSKAHDAAGLGEQLDPNGLACAARSTDEARAERCGIVSLCLGDTTSARQAIEADTWSRLEGYSSIRLLTGSSYMYARCLSCRLRVC